MLIHCSFLLLFLLAFCFVPFMNAMFYVLSASCFIVVDFIMVCDCWCSVCLSRCVMYVTVASNYCFVTGISHHIIFLVLLILVTI